MSLKIYCQSCCSPTEYSGVIPKFCSDCGTAFVSSMPSISPPKKTDAVASLLRKLPPKIVPMNSLELYYSDGDDNNEGQSIPNYLDKLDCEIIAKREKETFKEAVAQRPDRTAMRAIPNKKINKKKFLEEYQKEASETKVVQIGNDIPED